MVAKVVKIPMATVLCLVSVKGKYMCGRHTILQVHSLTDGGWSTLESIILIQVICFIERELMDLEIATILMVYNTTVEYALAPHCSLAVPHNALLRKINFSQVQAKFEHFVKESSFF